MIISTVLSSRIPQLEFRGSLGLLGEPKKFNVAITRGKALTIVIGCPSCLEKDSNWRDLMVYCQDFNSYHGSTCDSMATSKKTPLNFKLLGGGYEESYEDALESNYYGDNSNWKMYSYFS